MLDSDASETSDEPVIKPSSSVDKRSNEIDAPSRRTLPTIKLMSLEAVDPEPAEATPNSAESVESASEEKLSQEPVPEPSAAPSRKTIRDRIRRRFGKS
jgi:hypothetical protein